MEIKIDENFSVSRPFGPSIAKVKIPDNILNEINKYIDKTITDSDKMNELNYGNNLAGDVSQEFRLENEFMERSGWLNFLASSVQKWIKIMQNREVKKFNLINSWVVRQFKDEYNPVHWHGGHISGAGFLKIPETLGKHFQEKRDREYLGGSLTLIHGSRQFLSNSKLQIKPSIGDFYLFPNYLMHTVYPFKGTKEERRSISFNAYIDEDIYDIYK